MCSPHSHDGLLRACAAFSFQFLAKARFDELYPDDHDMAVRAFAAFMGLFGQITNGISFLFSLFGTSFVIQRFGLAKTLLAFPTIVTLCVLSVYLFPNLWVVFCVMMVRAPRLTTRSYVVALPAHLHNILPRRSSRACRTP